MDMVVACDLDGVVWLGDQPLPGASEGVEYLRSLGSQVVFVTNNSSLVVDEYLTKLGACGITASPDDLLTSGMVAAWVLATELSPGARVLACAGPGVREALSAQGFEVVERYPAEAVVVGWHRTFDFDELDRTATAIRQGARFIATNLDPTCPTPEGLVSGTGALVAAVSTASGCDPEVVGKPEPPMVELIRGRRGPHGVVIGDRPSTDGLLARALGWPFALVCSEATTSEGEQLAAQVPPDFSGERLDEVAIQIGRTYTLGL